MSVIIVNFNGKEVLDECLKSVFVTDYPNYEVIVVDNGSTDESCRMIKKNFPGVRLIEANANLGYSRGNNIGIVHSKGDFVVLLNNDTIVTPRWLSELVQEADKNPEYFYQPKILFERSKKINSAGNNIQLFGFAFPSGIGDPDIGQYDARHEASYASGACVLVSRLIIQKVGLLDEDDLFTYYEDVNWGWRGLMMGYKTVYVPSAIIYHKWGATWGSTMSSKKFHSLERGRIATLVRNYSNQTLLIMLPSLFLVELMVLSYSFLNCLASEKLKIYTEIVRARKLLSKQKRLLEEKRVVSDNIVSKSFCDGLVHVYLRKLSSPINRLLHLLSKATRACLP